MAVDARRVLVVDDDRAIHDLVTRTLRFAGFEVLGARNGEGALALAADAAPHLIVLDVMLPDLDGTEVCRHLREAGDDVPIIFLTARTGAEAAIGAFARGGDDYLTKPFDPMELVARVQAVLRRASPPEPDERRVLSLGDVELDQDRLEVRAAGTPVELTATELRLLRYLLANPGIVVSRQQILDAVWGPGHEGTAARVETMVSRLRTKLGAAGSVLRTVRGFGYVAREDPDGPDEVDAWTPPR